MTNKGFFLTFEGGEGGGKSTLIDSLEAYLKEKKYPVVKTREPGGTALGEKVRFLLLEEKAHLTAQTELCLFLASRSEQMHQVILPALKEGKIVLCDRFNDSSIAYQGGARGLNIEKVALFCDFIAEGLKPDLTFYLDIEPQMGLDRMIKNLKTLDRIESEGLTFHQKVRKAYLTLSEKEPHRIHVLDATQPKSTVFQEAVSCLQKALEVKKLFSTSF